jgi:hypothetical protein
MFTQIQAFSNYGITHTKGSSIGKKNTQIRIADDNLLHWYFEGMKRRKGLCSIFVDFVSDLADSEMHGEKGEQE